MCTECRETEKKTAGVLAEDDEFPVLTPEQIGRVVRSYFGVRDAIRAEEIAQELQAAEAFPDLLSFVPEDAPEPVDADGVMLPPFIMDMICAIGGGPSIVVTYSAVEGRGAATTVSASGFSSPEDAAIILDEAKKVLTHPLRESGGVTEDGEIITGMQHVKRSE